MSLLVFAAVSCGLLALVFARVYWHSRLGNPMYIQRMTISFIPAVMAQRETADGSASYDESKMSVLWKHAVEIDLPVGNKSEWQSIFFSESSVGSGFSVRPERCAVITVVTDDGEVKLAVTNSEFAEWFRGAGTETGVMIVIDGSQNNRRVYSHSVPSLVSNALNSDERISEQLEVLGWKEATK